MAKPLPDPTPGHPGSPNAHKEALRRHYRRLRRASLPVTAMALLEVARRELPGRIPAGRRLGLWWPIGAEPDLRALAVELHRWRPDSLALPVVEPWPSGGGQLRLHYRAWSPGTPLLPDACGIPAPAGHLGNAGSEAPPPLAADELALLLVPALAIDRDGVRLGSGGGWYDRLRSDAAWRSLPALAVLPAACVSAEPLPRDPWDVPFDGWLDEQGLHRLNPPPKVAGS